MSTNLKTKGDASRLNKEAQRKAEIEQRQLEQRLAHEQKRRNDQEKGLFQRTVLDAFVGTFAENYGEAFDYNSLANSLHFSFKTNKDGSITPSFTVDVNNIEFRSDIKQECREFNENDTSDFISNEEAISGEILDRYHFNNSEEYDAYIEGDTAYEDLNDLDGEFVPTTRRERYGTFNRINKLLGYTPPEESSANAQKTAKKLWQKLTNK